MFRNLYRSALTFFFLSGIVIIPSVAQDAVQIEGTVENERGDPLSGISISLEGVLTDPVVTDSTGEFLFSVPPGQQWLIISPAEVYKTKRIYLNGRENLRIKLSPVDLETGDDVMLDVLHDKPKREFISSVQAIEPGQFLGLLVVGHGTDLGLVSLDGRTHPGPVVPVAQVA